MNASQLRGLGAMLGILLVLFVGIHFYKSYQVGEHNWYFVVMACGMLLLLYYATFTGNRGGRRR